MTFLKTIPSCVVGIDVSKATLAVCEHGKQQVHVIANNCRSIRQFLSHQKPGLFVVLEPTGGYEALLVHELCAAGIACHRADTVKVKAFARSFGRLGKTDEMDARALAAYGSDRWQGLPVYELSDQHQSDLAALVARRQDLVSIQVAEKNRVQAPGCASVKHSCKIVLACIRRQLERLDQQIESLIQVSAGLSERMATYQSLPGVGPRTAIALMATMPELGTLTRRQAASLAGLAPHPNDSGTLRGYRKMRGGRPEVRKNLFMAALCASRLKGPLRDFYQRLIANGKKPIVAISALMRKIIVILNARMRDKISAMS
ncbi:IS110 family transposase [Pseudovibrio brasiliensis]|uniref:IS110 family transposase n=1 Tax=Pseudovibrio brasiliensis TaxID=1898042 RepID=A0ABX8ASC5_9HYPH|nr:IS110 family transposase [Pseudovibrio brasiliensis]QUS56220.1 IS110 family transposase [Pseudovibrio brasiliensis]QUS56713.1 IS110 family transposase [Pseudovibrio brasiliensis]QUS57478.1 IS110 family transposase [Pseudovibrio brasiliensis]